MSKQPVGSPDAQPLVVVGSSAGGIEALSVLVASLPADFPAPVVLAQHLDPSRPSRLESILGRHSTLPVVVVEDRTLLQPGTIYVVPSNRHVAIRDGQTRFEEGHPAHPRPSVDLLLSTAAGAYGEELYAVILTGTGCDGAAGAVEVHNAGGTVIIQDPATARYPSMPLALPPTAVDHILKLEDIGPVLSYLLGLGRTDQAEPDADRAVRDLLDYIRRQAYVDFGAYRPATLLRRLAHRMAVTHQKSVQDYRQYLDGNREELGRLVMAFLIGVTEFFRDAAAFLHLKHNVLPELIARGRARDRVLRLWSAGCATGEEAYSLAMLLADLLGEEWPQWRIKIFATDLSEEAITFARRGLYPDTVLHHLPEGYRERFFSPTPDGYQVSKSLREVIIFGQQDLTGGTPFPRIDLAVCRNLLIYFTPELQQRVFDMFAYSLFEGGILFLGKAETVPPSVRAFTPVDRKWRVYRCVQRPLSLRGQSRTTGRHGPGATAGIPHDLSPAAGIGSNRLDAAQLRAMGDTVLQALSIGLVIIDRSYRLLSINLPARRLLGIHAAGLDEDFLHAVHGLPYAELRVAIDTAFARVEPVTLPEMPVDASGGIAAGYLALTLAPLPGDGAAPPDLVAIHVADVSEQVRARQQVLSTQNQQFHLVQELSATLEQMRGANTELLDANARLYTANQELSAAQEDLAATTAEYEATNEELQAANEELETSNEQLQAANEELVTRTQELQTMTTSLDNERMRLAAMVDQAPFYIMILKGPDLRVEAVNTRAAGLASGREMLGRPLEEVFAGADMTGFLTLARETYRQGLPQTTSRMPTTLVGALGEAISAVFRYHLVPTYRRPGEVDGVIVYAEDVSEQVAREAQQVRDRLRRLAEQADPVALALFDARSLQLVYAGPRYLAMREQAQAETPVDGAAPWPDFPFLASKQEAVDLLTSVIRSRVPLHMPDVPVKLRPEAGESLWGWTLTPVADRDDPDKVAFVAFSMFDTTASSRARQELVRLDRLREEFLVLAAHELRTPLTPLAGYVQMLGRIVAHVEQQPEATWDPRIQTYIDKIQQQIENLKRLIGDLTDVARLQHGKFSLRLEPVDLARVLERAGEEARMFHPGLPIELTIVPADQPLRVQGDQGRLVQVVSNLLQNAIKYAPGSQRIDLRLSQVDASMARAIPNGSSGWAQIEVQDYGLGIAADELPLIFDRYYQVGPNNGPSRSAGLGMGLFLARAIAEQHNGTLTVQSVLGQGTTFVLRLPLITADATRPPA